MEALRALRAIFTYLMVNAVDGATARVEASKPKPIPCTRCPAVTGGVEEMVPVDETKWMAPAV
jgi:hypothetical protein